MGMNDSLQAVPVDLVSVREAAQEVGVTAGAVHSWIARGLLTAYAQPPRGRRVSLSAVRALCAPFDPQTPPEARLVYDVAHAVGLPKWRIRIWAERGLLPSWHGPHGRLVWEGDVRAVAQKQGLLPPTDQAGA